MQVAIVGAGLAGLTLARRLVDHDIDVVIIEREDCVGGLARSFSYENGTSFDVGPHRFHTDSERVGSFLEDTLEDDKLVVGRNSQLFLFDKYLPWPINVKSVLSLPPALLARMSLDLVLPRKAGTDSFEDYIIEKYGTTLYKVFFKPYTEKFLDYTCGNLHRDWAEAGINRATIDKQTDTSSLISLIKSVFLGKKVDTKFLYPKSGGIGVFAQKLAAAVTSRGAKIMLQSQVSNFVVEKDRIRRILTTDGQEISVDHVFWSGSLGSLRELGDAPENVARLHYISTVLFNYVLDQKNGADFQWCYFGDGNMEVDRVSVPRNFNPRLVPQGKEGLCVEIACTEGSQTWRDPARLDCVIETFLTRAKLIRSLDSVDRYHIEHVLDTYPLYALNYPRKLNNMFEWVRNTWINLTLIGRTGRFWYNNMDHSIEASLTVADRFIEDCRKGVLRDGDAYSVEDRHLNG